MVKFINAAAAVVRQQIPRLVEVALGEKPGDLPVVQSAKFEFIINLKTAKTLGLKFHPQLLATADEIVE
jgi:ABC-type uncharacterized transport system substrate-binding protein